jgi:hypothetical protein
MSHPFFLRFSLEKRLPIKPTQKKPKNPQRGWKKNLYVLSKYYSKSVSKVDMGFD